MYKSEKKTASLLYVGNFFFFFFLQIVFRQSLNKDALLSIPVLWGWGIGEQSQLGTCLIIHDLASPSIADEFPDKRKLKTV